MLRVLIIGGLLLIPQMSLAESDALLKQSEKAISQAMQYVPDRVEFSNQATDEAIKESQKTMEALSQSKPVMPSMPKLDLMNIPAPSAIDIGRLAQQGESLMGSIDQQTSRYETQILVFVSASMPETTVKRYVKQTQKIGAVLVFRGLVNDSMKDMQLYLATILGTELTGPKPTILIDPTLYDRFDIQQVPTTVVTESEIKPCLPSGCPVPVYHTVGGDVSLGWALGLVSRQIESNALKTTLRPLIKDVERL